MAGFQVVPIMLLNLALRFRCVTLSILLPYRSDVDEALQKPLQTTSLFLTR
jgi:hypothetical protein